MFVGVSYQLGSSWLVGRTSPVLLSKPPSFYGIGRDGKVILILTQPSSTNLIDR